MAHVPPWAWANFKREHILPVPSGAGLSQIQHSPGSSDMADNDQQDDNNLPDLEQILVQLSSKPTWILATVGADVETDLY